MPRYKDKAVELVKMLSRGGKNCYESVMTKSDNVNDSTGQIRDYYRALTDAIGLGESLSSASVAIKVCELRARYSLPRFSGNIQKQCIEELYKVFVVRETMEDGRNGKRERRFRPTFAFLVN